MSTHRVSTRGIPFPTIDFFAASSTGIPNTFVFFFPTKISWLNNLDLLNLIVNYDEVGASKDRTCANKGVTANTDVYDAKKPRQMTCESTNSGKVSGCLQRHVHSKVSITQFFILSCEVVEKQV